MPIHVICDSCNAEYNLKDEHGGKTVKCPKCQSTIDVPFAEAAEDEEATRAAPSAGHPVFHRDKFLLRQKHLSISEKYFVWDEAGNEIMFIQRPAHLMRNLLAFFVAVIVAIICLIVLIGGAVTVLPDGVAQGIGALIGGLVSILASIAAFVAIIPKRHVSFFTDASMSQLVLKAYQDQKVALFNATYTVADADEKLLGTFRKNYLFNIIRKRWYGYDADGSLLVVAKEDSLILALLRRFLGNLFGILRRNYIFLKPDQESVIGEFNRKFTLLDRYVLDMSHDRDHPSVVSQADGVLSRAAFARVTFSRMSAALVVHVNVRGSVL